MLKIRALNRESSSDEDAPTIRKEAQEEITLDIYNKALRLQCDGKAEEAGYLLQKLLEENIPQLESQGGLPKTMSTLKYSCYINIGNIAMNKGENKIALENYLEASELDKTDVTLWYKIGCLATKLDRFRQAAYAFIKGLECNESHWPCLDKLISLLFAMSDTIACLQYIGKALILDSDYTKGLVLRKKIYENNSATREYYQLFNPDYVLEPDLSISVDKEDEISVLLEVEKLHSRINEVEKALEPQPLPTIPVRKALEDYTWLSLGETLIDLHRYISENNMSHFSMVDLSKCMSQKCEDVIVIVENDEVSGEVHEEKNASPQPAQNTETIEIKEEEQMETDVMERRYSQYSENNGNEISESITPVQTDENEEMEQDLDDQEDNLELKQDKHRSQNRGTKRRRDLLSDLQIWGWHSKRKSAKKGKHEKDLTVEDAFRRIIPEYLLPNSLSDDKNVTNEDSINTVELYNKKILSPISSPQFSKEIDYFGCECEHEDVLKFWSKKWECCDVVSLIEGFVFALSKFWYLKWPKKLVQVYIEAYEMFREHCDHPQVFSSEITFDEIKNDALATILYSEILFNNSDVTENKKMHCTSISFLSLISGWEEHWLEEFTSIFSRVHWLRALIFEREGNNLLAIRYLQLVQEVILSEEEKTEKKYALYLPNCNKYSLISNEVIEKLLNHLEMIDSLSRLEQLYNNEEYTQVAEVLKNTFTTSTNHPVCGKMGRPAQIGMLLHSLWYTDITQCFIWSEECLYEALPHALKSAKDRDKWEMIVQKCIAMSLQIIKSETVTIIDTLTEDKRCRLLESLTKIICYQLNTESTSCLPLGTVTPWILLHFVLLRDEHRQQAKKKVNHIRKDDESNQQSSILEKLEDTDVPPSIAILFSGHEFLGPKGWCTYENGELLHFMLDTILDRLDTPIFESRREKIDIHIEQALFCLYQHPSKKNKVSRHLADHNVNPLPLTWERSHQLYQFYCPDALPEFDSYRSISITSDVEQLLQRIYALVPPECNPQPLLPKVNDFVQGNSEVMPETINFPHKVRAIYYLLGDYYFKQNEINQSIKYFHLDLCINPLRLDAWACLALGIASQLESKLNHCEKLKNENEFLDKAKSAQICFKQALKLTPDHITLWIEFGSFEYMVHSFCSRLLKYESDTLSMEKFEILENLKESYLNGSGESFTKALSLHQPDRCEIDERWLYHYMLAKISEKKQHEPIEYLQHYLTASALLNENNAVYPDKINYNNPQHLSLEALEVHYRIHASILKYLELHEGKNILCSVGKIFKRCLDSSTFPKKNYAPPKEEPVAPKTDLQPKLVAEGGKNTIENKEKCDNIQGGNSAVDEIRIEVQKCIEDILNQICCDNKEPVKVEKPVDLVTISDSDDEKKKSKLRVKDVQEIMDALMEETMKKHGEVTDTEWDEANYDVLETNGKTHQSEGTEEVQLLEKNGQDKNKAENKVYTKDEVENIRKSTEDSSSTASSSSGSSSSDESDTDDSSSSSSSTSSDTSTGNMSESDVTHLIDRCISGLEQCVIRLPQNYKALYRLAHLYFHYGPKKDINKCKQLLLGEYKCRCSVIVTGLFSDRKTSNFFNGVWRIPSSEIDRPGSLAAHMGRCVTLLLQVLRFSNDHKTLLDLCLQLRRTPDADKIYIRDSERLQLSEQALSLCIQSIRTQIKNVNTSSQTAVQKLLLDIFRIYQRVQKHISSKESVFASMLTEVYKSFVQNKIPENVSALDLAVKFCQQHRPVEKHKHVQQQPQSSLPRSVISTTNAPVLPAPNTNPLTTTVPLKRPGLGRPRGRPPGPKLPRSSKGRSSSLGSNSFAWQNPLYDPRNAYDYLKQYQEQLIRQYTQNLSYNQLAQLGHLFTQTHNPLLSTNNLLQQTIRQPSSLTSTADLSSLSLGSKKRTSTDSVPSTSSHNITMEQLRQFSSLSQTMTNQFNIPSTTHMQNISKSKSIFSMPSYSQSLSSNYKYSTADSTKPKVKNVTKTTASFQTYKEPSKTVVSSHKQIADFDSTNLLMKDRPNISITPVTQTVPVVTTNIPIMNNPPSTSTPGKTLQEKLAEKQKQLSNKNMASRSLDYNPKPKETTNIPSNSIVNLIIPSSLTVSKTSSVVSSFPCDSGISISQVPVTSPADLTVIPAGQKISKQSEPSDLSMTPKQSKSELTNLMMFRKESSSKQKSVSPQPGTAIISGLPSNIPMSLSVIKKTDDKPPVHRKQSSDDDVIIIE